MPHADATIDIRATSGGTEIVLGATSCGPGVDLAWQATVRLGEDGKLYCGFQGTAALSDCRYNRIGFVGLFPLAIAGRRYRAERTEGSSSGELPLLAQLD